LKKKIINQSLYFIEEGPGCGSEDIKKECNVNCFDFFLLFCVFMDAVCGKITIN